MSGGAQSFASPTHPAVDPFGHCTVCGEECHLGGPFPWHGYWTAADGSLRPCQISSGHLVLPPPSRPMAIRLWTAVDALRAFVGLAAGWTPEHTTGLIFGIAGALLGLCIWGHP